MSEHYVSKLTQQLEAFLDAFERLDTYVRLVQLHEQR